MTLNAGKRKKRSRSRSRKLKKSSTLGYYSARYRPPPTIKSPIRYKSPVRTAAKSFLPAGTPRIKPVKFGNEVGFTPSRLNFEFKSPSK